MDEESQKIAATAEVKRKAQYGELGESGTLIFSGIITGEEYSTDLIGRNASKVYDQMRRSDATVRASLQAMYLPIMQAQWVFEPASKDAIDVEIADFCNKVFFEIIDWHSFLSEALTMLPFGFSLFEMVFGMQKVDGKDRQVITKLAFRKQKTIYRWTSDKYGDGITQLIANGDTKEIPWQKLVIFTNQREGENYEGISVLRSAYQHWFIKSALYQIDSVAHERHALGVLDITEPAQADDVDRQTLIRAARNLRANEQSYINHKVGWIIQWMDMKAATLRDMMPSISHHDRQISKNVLAQFMELGGSSGGSSGSRAVSKDQTAFFSLAEKATAQMIADTLMQTAVKTIVDLNYTANDYPKLKATGLDDEDLAAFAQAFQQIASEGGVTMDISVENRNRQILGLPAIEEKDYKALSVDKPKPEVKKPPAAGDLPEPAKAAIDKAEKIYAQLTEAFNAKQTA